MTSPQQIASADSPPTTSRFLQFYALTKPRVVQLIVFCALIGMVLAVPGVPSADNLLKALVACAGIWLVAAAAAAFNCLVEQEIDARMRRTAWRPTARGELSNTMTLTFSGVLCALGSDVLYIWVNPLTMWLTFATFVGYAVVYTVILKPRTPQNIVIGGASGAMPPVLGWAAMTGSVEPEALMLDRPADPADIDRILLDHGDGIARLAEQIGGGEPGGAGSDDRDVDRRVRHQAFPTSCGVYA